jgi:hypothetical protein
MLHHDANRTSGRLSLVKQLPRIFNSNPVDLQPTLETARLLLRPFRMEDAPTHSREGIMREAVRKDGRFEDLVLYAVLAPDWLSTTPAPMPRVV